MICIEIYFNIKTLLIDYLANKKMLYAVKEISFINLDNSCQFEKILEHILNINILLVLFLSTVLIAYYIYKDRLPIKNIIKNIIIGVIVFVCIYNHYIVKDLILNLNIYLDEYINLHIILSSK